MIDKPLVVVPLLPPLLLELLLHLPEVKVRLLLDKPDAQLSVLRVQLSFLLSL